AVAGLMFSHSLALFSGGGFIFGGGSGITLSVWTFLGKQMYGRRQSGSRPFFFDSFFSIGGVIFPMIAALFLGRVSWVCWGYV
ncbi:MFS transporter TsgA, partial [Escherichia coli]|nr:MFS transporter TsgA [Escherichia coli]